MLKGFYDTNWVVDNDESNLNNRHVFTVANSAMSRKSSKQIGTAKLKLEYELITIELAGHEA